MNIIGTALWVIGLISFFIFKEIGAWIFREIFMGGRERPGHNLTADVSDFVGALFVIILGILLLWAIGDLPITAPSRSA